MRAVVDSYVALQVDQDVGNRIKTLDDDINGRLDELKSFVNNEVRTINSQPTHETCYSPSDDDRWTLLSRRWKAR